MSVTTTDLDQKNSSTTDGKGDTKGAAETRAATSTPYFESFSERKSSTDKPSTKPIDYATEFSNVKTACLGLYNYFYMLNEMVSTNVSIPSEIFVPDFYKKLGADTMSAKNLLSFRNNLEQSLGYSIRLMKDIFTFFEKNDSLPPEKILEAYYDLLMHSKKSLEEFSKKWLLDIQKAYPTVTFTKDTPYKYLINQLDNLLSSAESIIPNRLKTYWQFITIIIKNEPGKTLETLRQVRLMDYSQTYSTQFQITNQKVETYLKSSNSTLVTLAAITYSQLTLEANFMDALQKERMDKIRQVQTQRSRNKLNTHIDLEDTRNAFYKLYDAQLRLTRIDKEFSIDIAIALNLEKEQKNLKIAQAQNPVSTEATSEQNKKLIADYNQKKQQALEDYRKTVAEKRNKKALEQKKIGVTLLANAVDFRSSIIRKNLKTLEATELEFVFNVLINNQNIDLSPLVNTLGKLGFACKATTDNGALYSFKNYTWSYHGKHAAHQKSDKGEIPQDSILDLRKILWALGVTKPLIEALQKKVLNAKMIESPKSAGAAAESKENDERKKTKKSRRRKR